MANPKPTLPLKEIPEDVRDYILQTQAEIKIKKKIRQYSQQQTIFQIIREHKLFTKRNKG